MKLHGRSLSNYVSMVKHAILMKGIACEFVDTRPSQEPDYLAKSPMGKVPMLETEHGFLSETDAILDYLDENFPGPRLFPQDPFARAKVRQLMKVQELYVETPAHNVIGVLFNREIPQHVRDANRPAAEKGLAALARIAQFEPWIAGADITAADIFVYYSFALGNKSTQLVYQWDMLQEVPGLALWYGRFSELELTRNVAGAFNAAWDELAARNVAR